MDERDAAVVLVTNSRKKVGGSGIWDLHKSYRCIRSAFSPSTVDGSTSG